MCTSIDDRLSRERLLRSNPAESDQTSNATLSRTLFYECHLKFKLAIKFSSSWKTQNENWKREGRKNVETCKCISRFHRKPSQIRARFRNECWKNFCKHKRRASKKLINWLTRDERGKNENRQPFYHKGRKLIAYDHRARFMTLRVITARDGYF